MGAQRGTLEERLWRFISPEPNSGCWLWTGAVSGPKTHLYGVMWSPERGGKVFSHRVSYELINGPVPDGFDLDHLCRNTYCVNPDHLEAVTHKENMRRGKQFDVGAANRVKTHCPQGHKYTEENTYISKKGKRHCRECAVISWSSEERRKRRRK